GRQALRRGARAEPPLQLAARAPRLAVLEPVALPEAARQARGELHLRLRKRAGARSAAARRRRRGVRAHPSCRAAHHRRHAVRQRRRLGREPDRAGRALRRPAADHRLVAQQRRRRRARGIRDRAAAARAGHPAAGLSARFAALRRSACNVTAGVAVVIFGARRAPDHAPRPNPRRTIHARLARQNDTIMSIDVTWWWAALSAVGLANLTAWWCSRRALQRREGELPGDEYALRKGLLLLSAGYVIGCAYRSFVPVFDV